MKYEAARSILHSAVTLYRHRSGHNPEYTPDRGMTRCECEHGTVWTVRVRQDRQVQFHLDDSTEAVTVTAHGQGRNQFWTPYGMVKRTAGYR